MAAAGTVRPAVFLAYITVALAFRGALVAPLRASRPPTPRASAVAVTAEEALAVLDGAIDTAEDAALHLRRLVRGTPAASTLQADFADDSDPRPRLVILGSGWAAHALIKVIDTNTWRVLVVSPRNYFVFTPMLAATSVGTVEYRSITEPIREANPECSFVEGLATDIDVERRRVSVALSARAAANGGSARARADGAADVSHQYDVPYDVLAFACGVEAAAASVPGAAEHCFRLKDVEDAQQLRRAVGDLFERALVPGTLPAERTRLLTFVVVGGGPTGVEYTGELTDFIADVVTRQYPALAGVASVKLIHAQDSLLPMFDGELRDVARQSIESRGVEVIARRDSIKLCDECDDTID